MSRVLYEVTEYRVVEEVPGRIRWERTRGSYLFMAGMVVLCAAVPLLIWAIPRSSPVEIRLATGIFALLGVLMLGSFAFNLSRPMTVVNAERQLVTEGFRTLPFSAIAGVDVQFFSVGTASEYYCVVLCLQAGGTVRLTMTRDEAAARRLASELASVLATEDVAAAEGPLQDDPLSSQFLGWMILFGGALLSGMTWMLARDAVLVSPFPPYTALRLWPLGLALAIPGLLDVIGIPWLRRFWYLPNPTRRWIGVVYVLLWFAACRVR